jgi:hypothetical protein
MKRSVALALSAMLSALLACAGAAPPPERAVVPRDAEPPSRAVSPTSDCDSSNVILASHRPANVPSSWKNVGTLEVHLHGEGGRESDFTTYDVRDVSGKTVLTRPFKELVKRPGDSGDMAFRRFLAQGICSVGGVAAVGPPRSNEQALEEKLKKTGDATLAFEVLAPPNEDEAGDLERVCRKPAAKFDEEEPKMRVAHEFLAAKEEVGFLTSRKWRTWMGKVDEASSETMGRVADGFAAATRDAGKPSCFLPESLKKLVAQSPH